MSGLSARHMTAGLDEVREAGGWIKGFGSRLIERALASELGGEMRVAYEPADVVCTIDAPMLEIPETLRNPSEHS